MTALRTMTACLLVALGLSADAAAAERVETLKGEVVAVDGPAGTVTVRTLAAPQTAFRDVTIRVNGETKVIKDGARVELTRVKVADGVVVNYTSSLGGLVAVSIGVQPEKKLRS